MENKYQIAVDFIGKSYPLGSKKWKENVDTLQELIDKYSKLEKALDKTCEKLSKIEKDLLSMLSSSTAEDEGWNKDEWKEWSLKESEKQ